MVIYQKDPVIHSAESKLICQSKSCEWSFVHVKPVPPSLCSYKLCKLSLVKRSDLDAFFFFRDVPETGVGGVLRYDGERDSSVLSDT